MESKTTPLIKGMFINSHIKALRSEKGTAGLRALEERYGKPILFKNLEDVPVREEVTLIEHVLDLLNDSPVDPEHRSFEAGRLHFRNFSQTPFGKILMSALPRTEEGFRSLMIRTKYIGRHVFKNTNFDAVPFEAGVKITMQNSDYPIDHFRGLFYEWMARWDLCKRTVEARESAPKQYEYFLRW